MKSPFVVWGFEDEESKPVKLKTFDDFKEACEFSEKWLDEDKNMKKFVRINDADGKTVYDSGWA